MSDRKPEYPRLTPAQRAAHWAPFFKAHQGEDEMCALLEQAFHECGTAEREHCARVAEHNAKMIEVYTSKRCRREVERLADIIRESGQEHDDK